MEGMFLVSHSDLVGICWDNQLPWRFCIGAFLKVWSHCLVVQNVGIFEKVCPKKDVQ